MSKEKRIQECETKRLIDELSKMPPMVIATAYFHAINYTLYGEHVTEKWLTATQNVSALEQAYRKGYYDALKPQESKKTAYWIFDDECKEHGHCSYCGYGSVGLADGEPHNYCTNCGRRMIES